MPNSSPRPLPVPLGEVIAGAEQSVIGGLGDGVPPAALQDVDVIIHTAARIHVLRDRAADPYAAYRQVNVVGTANLDRVAVESGRAASRISELD